jgi:hypothetical protein
MTDVLHSTAFSRVARTCLFVLLFSCVALSSAGCGEQTLEDRASTGFRVERVAHAGGGYKGDTYTNSYQALSASLKLGFVYFEIDFVFTSDRQLVCLHDWKGNFSKLFKTDIQQIPSLEEFERLAAGHPKTTNCTAKGLAKWMREHPTAVLVSDVKGDNLAALVALRKIIPDAERRLIPQIYQPEEYEPVKALGYEQVIWTLYRFKGSIPTVVSHASEMQGPIAITMPFAKAKNGLAAQLDEMGIPTYVHTINQPEKAKHLRESLGVTEIYTDFLAPSGPSAMGSFPDSVGILNPETIYARYELQTSLTTRDCS